MKIKTRNLAIDILKIFCLIHMAYDHVFITLFNDSQATKIIAWLDAIIPLCPALFLFLSGYSISLGQGYKKLRKRLISAVLLWGIASLFFIIEHGFQFPDFLFAPGILYTIAINILIITLVAHLSKNKLAGMMGIFLIATFVFVILRLIDTQIFIFNGGYEPLLPTLLYGLVGFIWGELVGEHSKLPIKTQRNITYSIGMLSLFILIVLSIKYGFAAPLFPDVGRYTITRVFSIHNQIPSLFQGSKSGIYYATIWNFDILCFSYSLAWVVLLFIITQRIFGSLQSVKLSFLFLPARYLLFHYCLHLAIIALLTQLIGFNSLGTTGFLLLIASFIFAFYLFSFMFYFLKTHRTYDK